MAHRKPLSAPLSQAALVGAKNDLTGNVVPTSTALGTTMAAKQFHL